MLNILKKFKRKSKTGSPNRESLKKQFFSHDFHQWMEDDPRLKRIFTLFLDSLPYEVLLPLGGARKIAFVKASGRYGCSLKGLPGMDYVILFPELISLLRSGSPDHGLAVLAHELGHIFCNHGQRKIDPLEAQVEADLFAANLGYAHHLQDILLDFDTTVEGKVRIARLTSHIMANTPTH